MQQGSKPSDYQRNMLRSAVEHMDESRHHLNEAMQKFAQLAFNLVEIDKTLHEFQTKITDVIESSPQIPIENDIAAQIARKFAPKQVTNGKENPPGVG